MAIILNRLPEGMKPDRTKVCLNMIVRDEAHCIERCLRSVLPFISSWVIVDTGSTDNTVEIIREVLKDVPGEVFEREWKDFGWNRTEALHLAKQWTKHTGNYSRYLMFVDADEVFHGDLSGIQNQDVYSMSIGEANSESRRLFFAKMHLPLWFRGRVHEALTCETDAPVDYMASGYVSTDSCGGRHQKEGWREAEIKEILKDNQKDPRVIFHLAQMLEAAGYLDAALKAFILRRRMGGDEYEMGVSKARIAHLELDDVAS